jgi:acyl-CoA dehydrogenase
MTRGLLRRAALPAAPPRSGLGHMLRQEVNVVFERIHFRAVPLMPRQALGGCQVAAFRLTEEQSAFRARVLRLAADELMPLTRAGASGRVNRPLLRAMGDLGLLRDLFGGAREEPPRDAAAMQLCLLRESLAAVSGEAETALALQGLGSYPILQSGGPAAVGRWIPQVAAGTAVAAFALSEPGAGSDAAGLALAAEPDGGGWRLTGEKMWISNAPDADVYTVFARTTPGRAHGVTAFAVDGGSPGLTGEHLEMLSPHPIGRLVFDGVRVGRDAVLGEVDAGFAVAMRTLDLFRPSVGAFAVGMAQAALDATIEHVRTREVHGGPLARQQAVAHLVAEMATRLEASRLLVYQAAAAYDEGSEPGAQTRRSAMAKMYATESAQFIVDGCVQLHGAAALRRGHLLEHLYRDVRSLRIYEGATEIQRSIIARELIGKERSS